MKKLRNESKWMAAAAILPMVLASLSVPAISWAGGHSEGNGGDGVYVDGKLTLRDFLESNSGRLTEISDNVEFLKKTKDLIPLLQEISAVDPGLALSIWDQLTQANIWKTRSVLPLLPEAVTAVVEPKADVQIAIRDGNDIVIAEAAYAQVEQSYVLAHEALHGLIDGNGPMHHERVRAVVRYLHDKRGHYTESDLLNVLDKNNVAANGGPVEIDSA